MPRFLLLTFALLLSDSLFAQDNPHGYHAINKDNLDTTAKPTQNFYAYSVGNWIKRNPVPPSKSAWFSFNELYDNNRKVLHEVLVADAAKNAPKGTNAQKVGDFFKSGMDSAIRNRRGLAPLTTDLNKINAITTSADVLNEFTSLIASGTASGYSFYVRTDDKVSTKYIPAFSQGGLGLPDRDYYLKSDNRTTAIRDAYSKHIAKMLVLSGTSQNEAAAAAGHIMTLETALAKASMDRVERRDPYKVYHKFSAASFSAQVPGIDWSTQLKNLGIGHADSFLVAQPNFFKQLALLLKTTPISNWKEYLRWKLVSSASGELNDTLEHESFNFYGKVLNGSKAQELRWERLTSVIDRFMGEALGQEYIKVAFPPKAKVRMLELIANLKAAFAERIRGLDWMSMTTKEKALVKLNSIMVKVGYPDKWIDYSTLNITPDNYFQNVTNARKFLYDYEISFYGKPVDRTLWGMSPPTVNAYYNPGFNEIVFPAGILQPPFFDFKADDAVNYGAIGSVIGHEMTHGFDDQGRQYDAQGNLKDWWTKEDGEKFKTKAEQVAKQFDQYTVLDSLHVNGHLTLGENLADLGGTMISFQAFKKTAEGKSSVKIDGYTPDQRFFLGFAQVWRGNINSEAAAVRIRTDPHAPGLWRVIGPLSNNPDFYHAFEVKPGDKMYRDPAVRAKVW